MTLSQYIYAVLKGRRRNKTTDDNDDNDAKIGMRGNGQTRHKVWDK